MNEWEAFFLGQVGASAALAGLIFVGVSINLNRILSIPKLPNRALQALLLLVTVLIISSLQLIPGNTSKSYGMELIFISGALWLVMTLLDISNYRKTDKKFRRSYLLNIFFTQASTIPYIISAVILLSGDPNGIYWLVPGIIFSYLEAIADAWVLLIEINR